VKTRKNRRGEYAQKNRVKEEGIGLSKRKIKRNDAISKLAK
jgi:hypothetical protein